MKSSVRGPATVVELNAHQGEHRGLKRHRVGNTLYLTLCIIGAFLIRLDFMRAGNFVIDSDEAIVGLMAKHILEGASIPVFYYGQHYMGSLEPLCVAVAFWLFGASTFALQLVPLLFSLLLVYVVYRLGRAVSGEIAGRVAALLCAFPPVTLVVWSFKARGGFIELLVIGALALLCTVRWLRKRPTDLYYPVYIWSLLGLGWWVNNQIIYFIAPIALFGGLRLLAALEAREVRFKSVLTLCGVSAGAFFIASSPYWLYNLTKGFPSLGMFGFATLTDIGSNFVGFWLTALPILLGAKKFWGADLSLTGASVATYFIYGTIFASLILYRRRRIGDLLRGRVDRVEPVELFLFFILFSCAVFISSTFGWLFQAPRYLLPIYIGLFILCGVWAKGVFRRSLGLGVLSIAALIGINLLSSYWGGRALPGEPVVYNGERVSRDHSELISTLDSLGISLVRTNYWIGYRLAFETGERVKFRVLQEPRQVRIKGYQVLPPGVRQEEVPLLLVPGERHLFVDGLHLLGYSFDERTASGYVLIYNIKRPRVFLRALTRSEISHAQASGPQAAAGAVDGDVNTRWGTGASQRAGQFFEVSFNTPKLLAAINYNIGAWPQDYPRSLQIDLVDEEGERITVLSQDDYSRMKDLLLGGDLELRFPARRAAKVIFRQGGTHPILDWSIAELTFLQPDGAEPDRLSQK